MLQNEFSVMGFGKFSFHCIFSCLSARLKSIKHSHCLLLSSFFVSTNLYKRRGTWIHGARSSLQQETVWSVIKLEVEGWQGWSVFLPAWGLCDSDALQGVQRAGTDSCNLLQIVGNRLLFSLALFLSCLASLSKRKEIFSLLKCRHKSGCTENNKLIQSSVAHNKNI